MAIFKYLCSFVTIWSLLTLDVILCQSEPVCSKFDYEAKVLEKMIRMEIKVEQMFEEMKHAKESMEAKMGDFKVVLEKIQQNTSQREQNMESKFSSALITLRESVMTPTPTVAFNVRRTGDNRITVSTNTIIVFNDVILNAGAGYNSVTGIFTAPNDGLYYFSSQMCNEEDKYVYFAIVVNDEKITSSTLKDKDHYPCTSAGAMVILESNDRVWVKTSGISFLYQDSYRFNSFSGALVHK